MASVFLSYDRDDIGRARPLATALERAGHKVWWDRHIKGGAQYSKEIERALKAADAVVVLWSRRSVESAWVRDEAAAGRDTGRLVPVMLDDAEPPLGFRQYQTIDLSSWQGRGRPAQVRTVIEAVGAVAGTPPAAGSDGVDPAGAKPPLRLMAVGLLLLALAVAAVFVWRPWAGAGRTIVAVGAGQQDAASAALARDLAVKLGNLQAAQWSSMRLVPEGAGGEDPDFLLHAAAVDRAGANLLLTSRKEGSILWSREFQQPSGSLPDLRQQLALTAARVLACLMESRAPGQLLREDVLKTYLGACASFAETMAVDPGTLVPAFRQVVAAAPRFKPAWGKLLLAGKDLNVILANSPGGNARALDLHKQDIKRARQLDPDMTEALLAEAALLPRRNFQQILDLVERAARNDENNPAAHGYRADRLGDVGRLAEAVEAAKQVVKLDPLSPAALTEYINTLAYSGRLEAARRELQRAERLWPGTAALRDAQFRYHLRFGDPRIALAIEQEDNPDEIGFRPYLETRMDPTPAKVAAFLSSVRERVRESGANGPRAGFVIQFYGEFGAADEAMQLLLRRDEGKLAGITDIFFRPQLREIRRDPRFMLVAKRAGLVDYWQKSGHWPDFCLEPGHPYDCKAEAAKLR